MEKNVSKLQLRWNILRATAGVVALGAFILTVDSIAAQLWILRIVGLIIGIPLSVLVALRCDLAWRRIAIIAEGAMFTLALFLSLSPNMFPNNIPLLLLAFVTILFSEQTLNLTSRYSAQFSTEQESLLDFNIPTLGKSLNRLYRRLALNGLVCGVSYLAALSLLVVGAIASPAVPLLSDISIYLLVTSIALALLIILKEE